MTATPEGILANRLTQRIYRNPNSGAGNKGLFLVDGTEIMDPMKAAWIVLNTIPSPGPHHPTWYVADQHSGLSMDDLFHGVCPWDGDDLWTFFDKLIHGAIKDFAPKDWHLSRFNVVTNRRDERKRYFLDDPNRLCIESRFTNRYTHPAKREDF